MLSIAWSAVILLMPTQRQGAAAKKGSLYKIDRPPRVFTSACGSSPNALNVIHGAAKVWSLSDPTTDKLRRVHSGELVEVTEATRLVAPH